MRFSGEHVGSFASVEYSNIHRGLTKGPGTGPWEVNNSRSVLNQLVQSGVSALRVGAMTSPTKSGHFEYKSALHRRGQFHVGWLAIDHIIKDMLHLLSSEFGTIAHGFFADDK